MLQFIHIFRYGFLTISLLLQVLWTGLPCENYQLLISIAILDAEKSKLMPTECCSSGILKVLNMPTTYFKIFIAKFAKNKLNYSKLEDIYHTGAFYQKVITNLKFKSFAFSNMLRCDESFQLYILVFVGGRGEAF